jgi:hypothetical protein
VTVKLCWNIWQHSSLGAQCLIGPLSLNRRKWLNFLQLPINSHVILPTLCCVKAPGTEKKIIFWLIAPFWRACLKWFAPADKSRPRAHECLYTGRNILEKLKSVSTYLTDAAILSRTPSSSSRLVFSFSFLKGSVVSSVFMPTRYVPHLTRYFYIFLSYNGNK